MRSLTGYLKKTLLAISLLFLLSFSFNNNISAQETLFNVTSSFVHKVNGNNVNTELTLHLIAETTRVLSIYTVSIQAKNIKASCFTTSGKQIKCESYHRTSTTDIQMDLKNTVITPEKPLEIIIKYSYELENEITYAFPSKALDVKTEEVKIIYPKEKGDFSWISEIISHKEQKGDFMEVIIKNPKKDSISLFFNKYVLYSFSINRQFNNGNEESGETFELVVPLDDTTQTIIWDKIDPLPTSAIQDEDGNYILKYLVKSGESVSVKLSGYILKESNEIKEKEIKPYLSIPSGLWEIRDSTESKRLLNFMEGKGLKLNQITSNVDNLKNSERDLLYKFLYQYVIHRLHYSEDIVLGVENSARLGANAVVENALMSTQIDYVDFYIALLRSFSIPSRMIVGYVSNVTGYTTDGFYHYWVEYYDKNREEWIEVDPFLEEYSGHNIFGTKLNDHIAILKRGNSPMAPTLTFYSPTDFIVQIDNRNDIKKDMTINSTLSFDEYDITKRYAKAYITTSNTGNVIISKIDLVQSNIGNVKKYIDSVNNSSSLILLPKQTNNIQLNIPAEQMFFNNVSVVARYTNNAGEIKELTVSDKIPSNIPLYIRALSKILSLLSFGILILLFYTIFKLIKARKWISRH